MSDIFGRRGFWRTVFCLYFFLNIVTVSGCSRHSSSYQPVVDQTKPLENEYFSILPPQGDNVEFEISGINTISFGKRVPSRDPATLIAEASVARIGREIKTPSDLLEGAKQDCASDSVRMPSLNCGGVRLDNLYGDYCVRADIFAEDYKVPGFEDSPFVYEWHGYYVLHPYLRNHVMRVYYSQRYPKGKEAFPEDMIKSFGEEFLKGVKFKDPGLQQESNGTKELPMFADNPSLVNKYETRLYVWWKILIAGYGSKERAIGKEAKEGLALLSEGEYQRAMEKFNRAWLMDPENPKIYQGFAAYYGALDNRQEAIEWKRKGAEKGDAASQYNLADEYNTGDILKRDYVEAAKWYRRAADQDLNWALNMMGMCYEYGFGVPRSIDEAKKWYQKADERGNIPEAMLKLRGLSQSDLDSQPDIFEGHQIPPEGELVKE